MTGRFNGKAEILPPETTRQRFQTVADSDDAVSAGIVFDRF